MIYQVVFIRHGQSLWNKAKKFTGWIDIKLSDVGREEAKLAAQTLQNEGFSFDMAFCSVLDRAIETLRIVLRAMDLSDIPVQYNWRLNERHYGAFQGKYKPAIAQEIGAKKLHQYRRSYDVPPPPLSKPDFNYVKMNWKKQGITKPDFPLSESLKEVQARVLPYWQQVIWPEVGRGKKIIISAHGNSIRALKKYFDHIDNEAISEINVPTGIPLVYEFDEQMHMLKNYYLGDPAKIKATIDRVLNEAKKNTPRRCIEEK